VLIVALFLIMLANRSFYFSLLSSLDTLFVAKGDMY
jgi:hypothetical protein